MKAIFIALIYQPLYNGLIFLMDVLPWANAGLVVIIFTLLIKLILFPLSKKASLTQLKMREIEPDMKRVQRETAGDRQKQAEKMMALYREKGINPFSGILLLFIQLPILIALYSLFLKSGLPQVNADLLYSFVRIPENINMSFFGVNLALPSLILALLAGVTQYFQARLLMPIKNPKTSPDEKPSFQSDLAKSMNMQMRYFFPIFIFVILYPFPPLSRVFPAIPSAVALYLIISNIFAIGQELYLRRNLYREKLEANL